MIILAFIIAIAALVINLVGLVLSRGGSGPDRLDIVAWFLNGIAWGILLCHTYR